MSGEPETPREATTLPPPTSATEAGQEGPETRVAPSHPAARLTKIELEDYRGFRGHFELDLSGGQNLLLYGENGAGKSSLYRAITDFLESPSTFVIDEHRARRSLRAEDNRHRYSTDPAAVRLTFNLPVSGGAADVSKTYEWSSTKNEPTAPEMRTVDKGKGCLDYRALLKIHLLQPGQREIDLFPLFLEPILAHTKNPASTPSRTFLEEWQQINSSFAPYRREPARLRDWITEFNAGFERVVRDVIAKASELLKGFDDDLAVDIEFTPASYRWKSLARPRIIAKPVFRRLQHPDYSQFLNEARLSALAIALYLAGLKIAAAGEARLLVLDDILIGLDMANRNRMLDVIQEHFRDWQILIFTYSKSWFERLKEHVGLLEWGGTWSSIVLREEWAGGEPSPRIVGDISGDLLEVARRHLARKDFTAAAVYTRTALERLCNVQCAKAHLVVLHVASPRQRKLEDYVQAIEHRLLQLRPGPLRKKALKLIARVRAARAFVLNRESHFDVEEEDTLSAEVGEVIETVTSLTAFLAPTLWTANQFVDGLLPTPAEEAVLALAEARKLALQPTKGAALSKMALAHQAAWLAFGASKGVLLPMGAEPSASTIWKAAGVQGLLDGAFDERLKAARPYLFGNLPPEEFSPAHFEAAAALIDLLAGGVHE